MLQVRPYDFETDYKTTEAWREKRSQAALPPLVFYTTEPSYAPVGVIVHDEDTDCAAAWLYRDACGVICWMAWTVTNPDISPMKAVRAIDIAQDYLESIAREEGFLYMVGMFKQESMVKHFTKCLGFQRCDTDKGHFMTGKELT